jgi:hypothetical protein
VKLSRDARIPDLTRLLNLHADLLIRTGRVEEGLQTLTDVDKLLPPEAIALVPQLILTRAAGLIEMGHFNEAEALLDATEKVHAASGPATGTNPALLRVKLLVAANRAADARRAIEISAPSAVPNQDPFSANLQREVLVAEIDLLTSNVPGALASISELRTQILANPDRAYYKESETRADFVEGRARCITHEAGNGITLLQGAVAASRELYDPNSSPAVAEAEIALAACLLDAGRREESRGHFQHAQSVHAAHKELGEQYRRPLRQLAARL